MNRFGRIKEKHYRAIVVIGMLLIIAVSLFAVISGRPYFTRRNVRILGRTVTSYGPWSPIVIFSLIFLSTIIPPLPIPIPVIEIVAGLVFGFWPGVLLIWASQMVSSLAAYELVRHIGKRLLSRYLNNPLVNFYRKFIDQKKGTGVFIVRALLAAPFNISFIAGLTEMDLSEFLLATAFGILPEVAIFAYLGSLLLYTRIRLWYVLVLLVILGILPLLTSMVIRLKKKPSIKSLPFKAMRKRR